MNEEIAETLEINEVGYDLGAEFDEEDDSGGILLGNNNNVAL